MSACGLLYQYDDYGSTLYKASLSNCNCPAAKDPCMVASHLDVFVVFSVSKSLRLISARRCCMVLFAVSIVFCWWSIVSESLRTCFSWTRFNSSSLLTASGVVVNSSIIFRKPPFTVSTAGSTAARSTTRLPASITSFGTSPAAAPLLVLETALTIVGN
jgi:hypothetical protein